MREKKCFRKGSSKNGTETLEYDFSVTAHQLILPLLVGFPVSMWAPPHAGAPRQRMTVATDITAPTCRLLLPPPGPSSPRWAPRRDRVKVPLSLVCDLTEMPPGVSRRSRGSTVIFRGRCLGLGNVGCSPSQTRAGVSQGGTHLSESRVPSASRPRGVPLFPPLAICSHSVLGFWLMRD